MSGALFPKPGSHKEVIQKPPIDGLEGPVTRLDEPCVYFMQFVGDDGLANGLVKIGFTTRLQMRRHSLAKEVSCHRDWLVCLGTIPGNYEIEDFFHHLYLEHRDFGEWFKPTFDPPGFIVWADDEVTT